jgi:hypothetical protein
MRARARVAKPGNGGGLKIRSRRGPCVQIASLALAGPRGPSHSAGRSARLTEWKTSCEREAQCATRELERSSLANSLINRWLVAMPNGGGLTIRSRRVFVSVASYRVPSSRERRGECPTNRCSATCAPAWTRTRIVTLPPMMATRRGVERSPSETISVVAHAGG